ncbi:MAG: N-acetyl-gamma-glutamyl-phosphate reductase [Planctomycetota bacterium]|nr:N-acetyl-gamma-glutamyl-phosphate reductase [Planctomycetota bacterium]MDA1105278.1 N-acetyl-gamma-glutamyl-phosphate reductase [Planctomycetota bacterium]
MNHHTESIPVAVVGAAGYTGAELCERLLGHPNAHIAGLFGSRGKSGDGSAFGDSFQRFAGVLDLPILEGTPEEILESGARAVFLATPHEASAQLAPALLEAGCVVLDLSAAFRLGDAAAYPAHYGFQHPSPELLSSAAYGLADLNADSIRAADLIAVPGCYPTSAILALRPLVDAGIIDVHERIIIDSTSGVSGAGRHPTLKNLFCEVSQQAYGVLSHRHEPEIIEHSGAEVIFTPHLGPFDRGILSTIHVPLMPACKESDIRAAWCAAYSHSPFVHTLPAGTWSSVAAVRGTNMCQLSVKACERRRHAVITSAIDNLVKGAAGQAIHCFNLRHGLPVTAGLGPVHARLGAPATVPLEGSVA